MKKKHAAVCKRNLGVAADTKPRSPAAAQKNAFCHHRNVRGVLKLLRGNQGRSSTKVLISGLILSSFRPPRQKFGLSAEALWIS